MSAVLLVIVSLDIPAAGDPEVGRAKAALCAGCHVPGGPNPDPLIPKLSGQSPDYLVQELLDYQTGQRQDPVMSAIVKTLANAEDILDIAAFYASLPRVSGSARSNPLSDRGESLFALERCTFCHGDAGVGSSPYIEGAPVIGGQTKQYLFKTLVDIRDGTRIADKFGLMQRVLKRMAEEDIEAMAEYISTL